MMESTDAYLPGEGGQPSLNVSSILRRKVEREQPQSAPGMYAGKINPAYDAAAAYNPPTSPADHIGSYEKVMQAQVAFLRTDLMVAVALPFTLLLYVSGIAGLFSLTFGGVLCYLLDLIGSVEGTLICLALTLIAFTGTLMFAIREFISQSLIHFLLIALFAVFNFLVFVTLSTHFNVVTADLGSSLRVVLQVVLSTLPLLAACILSIFISMEIAEVELSTSFSVVYFLYALFLGRPRYLYPLHCKQPSLQSQPTTPVQPSLLISLRLQGIMHVLPVLISPWIHFALHRHVLSSSRTFVLSAVNAVLLPAILMFFSFQRHLHSLKYQTAIDAVQRMSRSIHYALSALCVVFALTVQDHPMFDELKFFSGKEEPIPTYIVMAMILLLVAASMLYSRIKAYKKHGAQDVLTTTTWEFVWIKLMHVAFDVCIGTAAGLFGSLINMPSTIIPINLIAIIALSEFHFEESWSALSRILLSVIVALSFLISFVAFTKSTIYYLNFGFTWLIPCTMQQLCQLVAGLIALSAILPVGIITPTFSMWMNLSDPLLPSGSSYEGSLLASINSFSQSNHTGLHKTTTAYFVRHVFAYGSIALAALTAALELMVLQQDWTLVGLSISAEDVYPTNFLLISTALLLTTTYFLHLYQAIGFSTSLVIVIIQGCKLLTLLDVGSEYIISIALLSISTVLPFVRQLSLYFQHAAEMEKQLSSASAYLTAATTNTAANAVLVSSTELVVYVIFHASACLLVGPQVSNMLLSLVLYGDMTTHAVQDERVLWWQEMAVTLSMWLGFVSCLLFVFYRKAKYLRSVVFGLSVLLLLVAFEGFGVLSISKSGVHVVDTNTAAANDYTHKPNSILSHDHSEFFFFMSGVLTVIAWMRYVSLQNFVSCLLYSIVFGFVSTKAMINWAFPWNPTFPDLTHGLTSFPFVFLLFNKVFNTFISLWNPKERAYPIEFQKLGYIAAVCWPIGGYFYSEVVHHSNHVVRDGIVWAALLGSAMMTLSFRAREVLGFLRKDHTSSVTPLVTFTLGRNEYSLVFLTTVLTLLWVLLSMLLQTSSLDNDVLFPVFALLILCCERKALPAQLSPGQLWCVLSVLWWYGSVVYHILLRGYGEDNDGLVMAPYSMFGWDEEISLWTSKTLYLPLLNLALAMVPYPAIFMSLRRHRGDTEEMLFVLAILSGVAVIGGSVDCIRYLGLVGVFSAGYRCFEIGRGSHASSNSYM